MVPFSRTGHPARLADGGARFPSHHRLMNIHQLLGALIPLCECAFAVRRWRRGHGSWGGGVSRVTAVPLKRIQSRLPAKGRALSSKRRRMMLQAMALGELNHCARADGPQRTSAAPGRHQPGTAAAPCGSTPQPLRQRKAAFRVGRGRLPWRLFKRNPRTSHFTGCRIRASLKTRLDGSDHERPFCRHHA